MESDQIIHDVAERVRAIVTEAEERAAQIVRDAEADAERIRARAESDGRDRLDEVRRALDDLQGKLGNGARAEVTPGPVIVPEPQPPTQPDPGPVPVPEPSPDPTPEPAPPSIPEPTPPPDEGTPPQMLQGGSSGRSNDTTAARLVAMNMALDGAAREAIEGHLSEFYALDNPGAIVDDVLALTAR